MSARGSAVSVVVVVVISFCGPLFAHAATYCLSQSRAVEARPCTSLDRAEAEYNRTYNATGWDTIVLTPAVNSSSSADPQDSNATSVVIDPSALHDIGYLEGFLTHDTIWAMYSNSVAFIGVPSDMAAWIDRHETYMINQSRITANSTASADSPPHFWEMVGALLQLIHGLHDGYNAAVTSTAGDAMPLNRSQLFWLSFQFELYDLEHLFPSDVGQQHQEGPQQQGHRGLPTPRVHPRRRQGGGEHCSGLIKVTSDDVFVSHATWDIYNVMLRQYKVYNLPQVGSVAMSGYPGVIHSMDGWYITQPQQLVVQETTNLIYNSSLFTDYLTTSSVSEFLRTMVANFLARDGATWVELMNYNNSGTENNQWMIVDMKRVNRTSNNSSSFRSDDTAASRSEESLLQALKRGASFDSVLEEPLDTDQRASPSVSAAGNNDDLSEILVRGTESMYLPNGTLTVYEQLPGPFSEWGDVTAELRRRTYWASYNTPYFPRVYALSGNLMMEREYGSYFSYHKYARAELFHRGQSGVTGLADMKRLMRYNNFQNDALSRIPNCSDATGQICNPPYSAMLSIASRGDLDPVASIETMGVLADINGSAYVGQQNLAAIDAKIASWQEVVRRRTDGGAPLDGWLVCGPTSTATAPNNGSAFAPFNWSTSPVSFQALPRLLLADVFDFDWQKLTVVRVASPGVFPAPAGTPAGCPRLCAVATAFIALSAIVVAAAIAIHYRRRKPQLDALPLISVINEPPAPAGR